MSQPLAGMSIGTVPTVQSATLHINPIENTSRPCTHFVRFSSLSDQRFGNAVRIFGRPDFLHRHWDQRARREIAAEDVVVFAKGDADQPVVPFNGNDEAYP